MKRNSTNFLLIKCFFIAFSLALPIYLNIFELPNRTISTVSLFMGFYFLLDLGKKGWFFSGFFVGLLIFYWIGLSFRFVGLSEVVPLIILAIGVGYGLLFLLFGFISNYYIRAFLMLFFFDYIAPFGFDWFKPEVLLIESFVGIQKWQVALFFLAIVLFRYFKEHKYRLAALLPLLFSVHIVAAQVSIPSVKIVETDIAQDEKWAQETRGAVLLDVLSKIQKAVEEDHKIILLPESVIPLYLNESATVVERLKKLSKGRTIIVGSLYKEENEHFNSSYFF